MWVFYLESESYGYIVGFYAPNGRFKSIAYFDDIKVAASVVHYLNGGEGELPDDVFRQEQETEDEG